METDKLACGRLESFRPLRWMSEILVPSSDGSTFNTGGVSTTTNTADDFSTASDLFHQNPHSYSCGWQLWDGPPQQPVDPRQVQSPSNMAARESFTSNSSSTPSCGNSLKWTIGEEQENSSTSSTSKQIHPKAVQTMTAWMNENISNPYPDSATRHRLARECGISPVQVGSWFSNRRRRLGIAKFQKINLQNSPNPVESKSIRDRYQTSFRDRYQTRSGFKGADPAKTRQLSGLSPRRGNRVSPNLNLVAQHKRPRLK